MRRLERYRFAVLAERGLREWEIAQLSDRYIDEIYFHPRDEHGALIAPTPPVTAKDFGTRYEPPKTMEEELQFLADLQVVLVGTNKRGKGLDNYNDAVEQIKARWADGSRALERRKWEEAGGG